MERKRRLKIINTRSISHEEYLLEAQTLAALRDGKCLSTEYIGANAPLSWECDKGHKWDGLLSNIRNGNWCETCRKERVSFQKSKGTVQNLGGKVISNAYFTFKMNKRSMKVVCKKGHQWTTNSIEVRKKIWCKKCN